MRVRRSIAVALGMMIAVSGAAQDPVATLQDLIGARGAAVDGLEGRGYTYHHTAKTDDSSYTYWLEEGSDRCVAARVTNGEVASIVYSDGDCVETEAVLEPGFFATVCGVIREGETYRYRCEASDATEDGRRVTVLRLPDNELKFLWMADGRVEIEREGLAPEQATYSTSEGETDVFTDEMTYFYISDPGMAEMEVRNFRE